MRYRIFPELQISFREHSVPRLSERRSAALDLGGNLGVELGADLIDAHAVLPGQADDDGLQRALLALGQRAAPGLGVGLGADVPRGRGALGLEELPARDLGRDTVAVPGVVRRDDKLGAVSRGGVGDALGLTRSLGSSALLAGLLGLQFVR
jgi:hypothetical protein